jgi:hypothetical protein
MSQLPSIKVGPLAGGAETVEPIAGADGLAFALPIAEAAIGDDPPFAPVLVKAASATRGLREMRTANQQLVTCPTRSKARALYTVEWPRMTSEQRAAMLAWLLSGVEETRLGWRLRPDGPTSTPITVRFTTPLQSEWVASNVHEVPLSATVEELFS